MRIRLPFSKKPAAILPATGVLGVDYTDTDHVLTTAGRVYERNDATVACYEGSRRLFEFTFLNKHHAKALMLDLACGAKQ